MNLLRRLLPGIALIAGTFLLSVGLQTFAFTEPSAGPTGGTVYAPLNTGPTAQTKSGNLTIGGQITITGGTPGAGKVLTSNASGLASWTTPAAGGTGTVTSVATNNGLTGGTITTTGTLGLDLTGISTCTNSTSNKIYWNGSYLACGTDQTGGGGSQWVTSGSNIYYNSGNVGIGTASPSEKLHINGSVYVGSNWYKAGNITSVNNAISIWGAEGGVVSGFASGRAVGMGQTTSGYAGTGISSGATSLAAFYHDNFSNETVVEAYGARGIRFPTNGATRMTITSGGNIGIGSGMSSPWAQLDVGGAMGVNGVAFRAMDNTFSRFIMIVPYLGAGGYSGVSQSGDSGIFSAIGTGLVISPWNGSGIRIDPSGNVGIGTSAPDNKLTVNGSANKPGGGSWGTYSDARLKDIISTYTIGLDEVLRLTPTRYRYKSNNAIGILDNEEHVGFVAQDVESVIPEAISYNQSGYRILNNDPILWAMLNAVKEQQKEIESLKARIDALEKK